jgi:hypothetical protein
MDILLNGIRTEEFQLPNNFILTFDFKDDIYIGLEAAKTIDSCFTELKNIESLTGTIEFNFYSSNEHIDLCVIGNILLLLHSFKQIKVNIHLLNISNHESNIGITIYQYLSLLPITDKKSASRINVCKWENKTLKNSFTINKTNWRKTSSKFLPIILINEESKKELFYENEFLEYKKTFYDSSKTFFTNLSSLASFKGKNINEILYNSIRDNYFAVKDTYTLHDYFIESYLKLLADLRYFETFYSRDNFLRQNILLSQHLKDNKEEPFDTKKTKKSFRNTNEYFNLIDYYNNRLEEKPALFFGIFSIIARTYVTQIKNEHRVSPDFVNHLKILFKSLFYLTEQLTIGLKELFNNVLEHSTAKTGVLLFRIFTISETEKFKENILPGIKKYLSQFSEDIKSIDFLSNDFFLDINLFDISNIGILDKYQERGVSNIKLNDVYNYTPLSPAHTLKRMQEKIGLILFNRNLNKVCGYFYVSTPDTQVGADTYCSVINKKESNVAFTNGSHYNIIIPLCKIIEPQQQLITIGPSGHGGFSTKPYKKTNETVIWDYTVVDSVSSIEQILNSSVICEVDVEIEQSTTNKYHREEFGINTIKKIPIAKLKECIVAFNFEHTSAHIKEDMSFLKRFIDNINDYSAEIESKIHCIFIGIKYSVFQDMLKEYEEKGFLINNVYLFYLVHPNNYCFPALLAGENFDDYRLINKKILKLSIGKVISENEEISNIWDSIINNSPLFYTSKVRCIKEFDVLLHYNGTTIFEQFAQKCLETTIDKQKEDGAINDIRFQGYKIEEGHFKLGSKIHISDFYYAKRMFEINEFASKYALLIVDYLRKTEDFSIKNVLKEGLTIIGYAKYSDLLIYNIKILLEQWYTAYIDSNQLCLINHNILQDVENLSLLFKSENNKAIHKNVLFVIPISSTFSTCFKMEEGLIETEGFNYKGGIGLPVINVINVADESAKNHNGVTTRDITKEDTKLYPFGWKSIHYDEKTVIVNNETKQNNAAQSTIQKYFIQVYTNWYLIDKCELCFGNEDDTIEELPLVETDKASVTPQLIFGDGLKYTYASCRESLILPETSHHYGHYKIDNKHNVHFIDPREVIDYNNKGKFDLKIEDWLEEIKEQEWYKKINGNVTIITPDGKFNSDFVYVVNEVLFDFKANIIKYNPETDYIVNFKKFYESSIFNTDDLIYVDDQISTGTTFANINNYLKSCDSINNASPKEFTALITLICRSDDSILKELALKYFNGISLTNKKNNPIQWFKYLRVPTVVSSHLDCPLCIAQDYYYLLAEEASLDPTKTYLVKKANKLTYSHTLDNKDKFFHSYDTRVEEIQRLPEHYNAVKHKSFFKTPYGKPHQLKLAIENFLYKKDFLSDRNIKDLENLDKVTNEIFESLDNNLNRDKRYDKAEILLMLLKVLSFSPFVNYYTIRKIIFKKLVTLLDKQLKDIKENPESLNSERLRTIKLLMKRIAFLKGNYLIRTVNIEKLLDFYKAHDSFKAREGDIDRHIERWIQTLIPLLKINDNKTLWLHWLNDPLSLKHKLEEIVPSSEYKEARAYIKNIISSLENKRTSQEKTSAHIYSESILQVIFRFRSTIYDMLDDKNITWTNPPSANILQHIVYSCRALYNLDYRRRSWTDFHYFIAHLSREILQNSDAKAIKLDDVLTKEFDSLSNKDGATRKTLPLPFRLLLRILKLENTSIIKKHTNTFIKAIKNDAWNERNFNVSDIPNLLSQAEPIIEATLKNSSYYYLEKFLINENNNCREKTDKPFSKSFSYFLQLKHFLDENNAAFVGQELVSSNKLPSTLSGNVDFILQNIKKLLLLDKNIIDTAEAYLFIRYTPIQNNIINAEEIFPIPTSGSIAQGLDLAKSFVLKALNGLALREHGGKQNIFEFNKDPEKNNQWRSLKHYYVDDDGNILSKEGYFLNDMPESSLFGSNFSHLLFYRITDFKISKEKYADFFKNNGQAILLLATNREDPLKAEKLRYLTLLKDSLSTFFRHHYLTDSFREFLIVNKDNLEWNTFNHGVNRAKNEAFGYIEKITSIDKYEKNKLKLLLLSVGQVVIIKNYLKNYNSSSPGETFQNLQEFEAFINDNVYIALSLDQEYHYYPKNSFKFVIEIPNQIIKIKFSKDIFQLIIMEIVINFKKNTSTLDVTKINLTAKLYKDQEGDLYINWVNIYHARTNLKDRIRKSKKLQPNKQSFSGLQLITALYKKIYNCDVYCIKSQENSLFTLKTRL